MIEEHFKEELNKESTNFFILDTKSNDHKWDIDYIKYSWETDKYKQVKEGDLFIYRRPKKSSENNKFYFFGAGKIDKIIPVPEEGKKVEGIILKPIHLPQYIFEDDLLDFNWTSKRKGTNWANFFSQYGMNKIHKQEFLNILKIAENNIDFIDYDTADSVDEFKKMKEGNFYVDDSKREVNGRQNYSPFANDIKRNYYNKCAICSISTKAFLVASHIIPWAKNKENRLNPENAICLCSFHDKAFDRGYLTFSDSYKVITTNKISNDPILKSELVKIHGKKISLPKIKKPNREFLQFHRNNIFENNI